MTSERRSTAARERPRLADADPLYLPVLLAAYGEIVQLEERLRELRLRKVHVGLAVEALEELTGVKRDDQAQG